ncbi:MAG: hypothetical protein K2F99_07310 [Muribaculaceae bacterium]|nr:hypothetical protein [Muribaculaceae bacterium]
MKAFLKILITFFAILLTAEAYGQTLTPPFPLTKDPIPKGSGSGGGKDEEDDGHRAPARRVYCTIDWASGEIAIQGYDVADIETFEILDETQTVCYCSTTDSADFLANLAHTKGVVCIVFYFADFKLQGYYEY